MRSSARERELDRWATEGELDRRSTGGGGFRPTPRPTTCSMHSSVRALRGERREEAIASEAARESLIRIAVALDRAGERAPAHGALDAVRSALGRSTRDALRSDAGRGFFGRETEFARIAEWLSSPTTRPVRALFITGLPGIGKSTLVDEAARRASSGDPPSLVVRLDFDRSGLDVQDRVGLTLEISRQVAIAVGDEAATLRRHGWPRGATTTSGPASRANARACPVRAVHRARRGRRAGRPTDSHAPGHASRFCGAAARPIPGGSSTASTSCARRARPIAVSPPDAAMRSTARRPYRGRIELDGLDPADADAMLSCARRAADGVRHDPRPRRRKPACPPSRGPRRSRGWTGGAREGQGRREVAAAYLYRFLLSRIGDQQLRDLAEPGLVVRRINPDVIAEVLAPALRLGQLEPGEAATLFEALATHHWLVEPDPCPAGCGTARTSVRCCFGSSTRARAGRTAARIDRAAAKWFAGRTEPFAPSRPPTTSCRRCAGATSRRASTPRCSVSSTRRRSRSFRRAQDLVHIARGERTSQFRADTAGHGVARRRAAAADELEALLERGDLVEAAFVHDRSFAHQQLQPGSPEADIDLTFLWRAGAGARRRARRPTPFLEGGGDTLLGDRSPLTVLALLEIWAELRFASSSAFRATLSSPTRRRSSAQGIKGSLANGALGFALLVAGSSRRSTGNLEDPIERAAAVGVRPGLGERPCRGSTEPSMRWRCRRAVRVLVSPPSRDRAERHPSPRGPAPSTPPGAARLLATSTPYGSVAEALRRLGPDERVSHLSRSTSALAEQGGLPPSGAGGWSVAPAVSPEGSIDNLAALGLLAEWLGAAAFVLRHPDLRRIGAGRAMATHHRW